MAGAGGHTRRGETLEDYDPWKICELVEKGKIDYPCAHRALMACQEALLDIEWWNCQLIQSYNCANGRLYVGPKFFS